MSHESQRRPAQPPPPQQETSPPPDGRGEGAPVVIRVDALHAGYVNSHILFGVDFEAREGDITVIVGPNGCGKSTLLKSIFGLCTIYSGDISFEGQAISDLAPYEIARRKIAYLPQVNNVFANLTIRENLVMASYTIDSKRALSESLPGVLDAFPVLRELENVRADTLSGGQRQMLAMAMALIRRPTVMLFDEPTASLSPKLANTVVSKIREMRDNFGITVVLVEQDIRRALRLGDYAYLLASGKGVFRGRPKDLLDNPDLGKMYLGMG